MEVMELILIMLVCSIGGFMASCYILIQIIKKISRKIKRTSKRGTFKIIKRGA